jgi:hypothetical protein
MLGFDTSCELYSGDALFSQSYTELSEGGKRDNYVLLNGYLFHDLQLYVPIFSLREHIIHELYCMGHFRQDKTLALVSINFYWPKLPG